MGAPPRRRPRWICIGLLFSFLLPLPAQEATSKEKAEAALAEFREYSQHRNAHVRKAAVDGLAGTDHQLVTRALLLVLKDPEPMVCEAAVAALARQTNPLGLAEMIQRMWHGRDKEERLAILEAFRGSRPRVAYSAIQELTAAKEWEIRAAAATLIGCYPDEEEAGVGTVLPLVEDREPLVRLAALDALTDLKSPRGQAGALKGAGDRDWRVKAAAIKAMRTFRQKSAVQPLIDLLKGEKGRLQDDATAALVDITGFDFPGDADRWQEWWDRVKEGFKIPTLEELEARKKKEAVEARRPGYDPPRRGEYPPYHGIKTRSRNMIFLIDISASMAESVTLDERDGLGVAEFQKRYGDLRVKIDIAREELINLIAGLPDYARFNILTFNAGVDPWQKGLVPATQGQKNKAFKFLAKLTVDQLVPTGSRWGGAPIPGQTNTFEALAACFGLIQGQEQEKNSYKTDADTAFLLSDGMPTIGRIVDPQELLDFVETVNRRAKMVVHTISFGASNQPLMESIARLTEGQYVMIGH